MARTNTDKLKLPKHDTGDLNWGGDFNEGLDALDEHLQRETLRPPRTLTAQLGSGAVGAYLLGNTTYYYKVTAINSVGESTEGKIPVVVEASVTQGATPVPVLLEWEAVAGATGYRVYKAASSGAEKFLAEKSGGSTVTHTDDGNTDTTTTDVPGSNTARASVTGIRKTGEANPLRGDVKLKPGSGIALTQLPGTNEIEIASPADVLAHALGGAEHAADSLANLNAKISDATLMDQAAVILQGLADAKGDLIAASGPDAWARVPVGADGEVLTADAASPAGVKWAAAAGGGGGGYATVVVEAPSGNATTDTANIQAALDSLGANGGTVVLREGVYYTNASLSLKPGTRLIGQGMHGQGTVTSRGTRLSIGSQQYAFVFADAANPRDIQFEDFTIESSYVSGGATTLNDSAVSDTVRDIWFKRVRFYNHNANFNTNSGKNWDRCRWIGCHFDRSDRSATFGRLAANSSHFEIRGNKFYTDEIGLYGGNGTPGLGGCHVFADNIIECPLSATTPSLIVQAFFCAITGNVWRITGAQTSGTVLKLNQKGHTVTGNNIIHSTAGPYSIELQAGADECAITGNRGDSMLLNTDAANNVIVGNRLPTITDNSGAANVIANNG